MRMIGIGLLGFLLAGVALLLSTMNILEQGERLAREIVIGPQLVFENRHAPGAQDGSTVAIMRASPDQPVILSGFPAYQSVAFSFPKDARATSGYLQINATAQVLAGVEGVLRISITGTRRGELLLRPGEAGRSLQIPMSPSDLAGDQLVVSFSLQGNAPSKQCGPEDGISAVVEIETTSALHLVLDRPLTTARDRVHAWGDVVRVAWPSWLKRDEQLRRLVLGAKAKQHDLRTQFVAASADEALTTIALREVLDTSPAAQGARLHDASQLTRGGVNAGLRRFHRTVSWRTRYKLVDGADQPVPSHIDLHIAFGELLGNDHWSLTVTLNNRLVLQDSFQGRQDRYHAQVKLPVDWQAQNNQIEIVATTTAPHEGICNQGPELVAELLPEARLVPGPHIYRGPIAELRDALGATDPLNAALTTSLTAPEAEQVATWLAHVSPPSVTLQPARQSAHVIVADPGSMPMFSDANHPVWVLTQGADPSAVDVVPLQPGQSLPDVGPVLLIAPRGIDVSGMAS